MKKLLLVVIALVAVAIASFLWVRAQMGITDAARLVPSDAVVFVSFPDLPRSAMRWPRTTLAQIGAEPEMAAFLEKPMANVTGQKGGVDAAEVLVSLKPGRVFGVLTSADPENLSAVVGFQYWGSQEQFDSAMERLRDTVYQGSVPEGTTELHEGVTLLSTPLGDKTLTTTSLGRWGFISNDRTALHAVLDRAAGREVTNALAGDADYSEVSAHLPGEPDMLVFLRPGTVLDSLLAVGQEVGAVPDERQIEQIRSARAVGFAAKFDGADIADALFILSPSEPGSDPKINELTHHGMKFTSPQTLGYFDFLLRFEDLESVASQQLLAGMLPQSTGSPSPMLARMAEALEGEVSFSFSWPVDAMRPDALVAMPLRDAETAEHLLMEAVSLLPETTITERDGIRYFGFPSLTSPFVEPTLAIGAGSLLVGIDPVGLDQAIARSGSDETLQKSPAFSAVQPAFQRANETFGYLDSKAIFERAYPMLRQVVVFGAALVPGASDMVDATKLPETETIAKHLTPIVYSQTRLPEGILIESAGPISMNQVLVGGAGIGALFYGSRLFGP